MREGCGDEVLRDKGVVAWRFIHNTLCSLSFQAD